MRYPLLVLTGITLGLAGWLWQLPRETVGEETPVIRQANFSNGLEQEMIWVPAGSFRMGDLSGSGRWQAELPVRTVELSGYHLGATEVTQKQWQTVMGNNPSNLRGEQLPVETVNWQEAMEFCTKLTEIERTAGRLPEGYLYTLPTEAQWEKACRAGTEGDYAGELGDMAWYGVNSGYRTNPVAMKQPNAWGFFDMHGNVWEFCRNRWQSSYHELESGGEPEPESEEFRVVRGGSWLSSTKIPLRSSCRDLVHPTLRVVSFGFRIAVVAGGEHVDAGE